MTDPREPERPEQPGISLPPWVDDAIAKSGGKQAADPNPVTDAGPAAEMAVNPPPTESPASAPAADPEQTSSSEPGAATPVEVHSARGRNPAMLLWLALALLFLGAALVIGYVLLTRVPR